MITDKFKTTKLKYYELEKEHLTILKILNRDKK